MIQFAYTKGKGSQAVSYPQAVGRISARQRQMGTGRLNVFVAIYADQAAAAAANPSAKPVDVWQFVKADTQFDTDPPPTSEALDAWLLTLPAFKGGTVI